MSPTEARKRALELWGGLVFATRISYPERDKRFVVGIAGPITGDPLPLGLGASFEDAFAYAEREGYSREKIDELRRHAGAQMDGQYELRRAQYIADCEKRAGVDSEEFRKAAGAFFDEAESTRRPPLKVELQKAVTDGVRFEVTG